MALGEDRLLVFEEKTYDLLQKACSSPAPAALTEACGPHGKPAVVPETTDTAILDCIQARGKMDCAVRDRLNVRGITAVYGLSEHRDRLWLWRSRRNACLQTRPAKFVPTLYTGSASRSALQPTSFERSHKNTP